MQRPLTHTHRTVRAIGVAMAMSMILAACIAVRNPGPPSPPSPPAAPSPPSVPSSPPRPVLDRQDTTGTVGRFLADGYEWGQFSVSAGATVSMAADGTSITIDAPIPAVPDPRSPVDRLRDLGAPAAVIDQFVRDHTAGAQTLTIDGTPITVQPAWASSAGTIRASGCAEQRTNNGAVAYGCYIRYDAPESDPGAFYRWDETWAIGHGSAWERDWDELPVEEKPLGGKSRSGSAITLLTTNQYYAGHMIPLKWTPSTQLRTGECKSYSASVSLWGLSVGTSFLLCPDKVTPRLIKPFYYGQVHQTEWAGERRGHDDATSVGSVMIAKGPCFCVDDYRFTLGAQFRQCYTVWGRGWKYLDC
ncbi:MAG: hypothetical protein KatS3mg015_2911 [Fimbriimonadales bacterium]|nr:MAG: hypothetical protein KatS3mg015_2911 [Fimbriimonadales bacterium]